MLLKNAFKRVLAGLLWHTSANRVAPRVGFESGSGSKFCRKCDEYDSDPSGTRLAADADPRHWTWEKKSILLAIYTIYFCSVTIQSCVLYVQDFIPEYAKRYGFEYEYVQYKWPRWLNQQTEKQRTIWGYKILFLDVLFPLSLKKIIFVDTDQGGQLSYSRNLSNKVAKCSL
jgi:hypothetical protein